MSWADVDLLLVFLDPMTPPIDADGGIYEVPLRLLRETALNAGAVITSRPSSILDSIKS